LPLVRVVEPIAWNARGTARRLCVLSLKGIKL
jgi:hypothetical protein